MAKNPNMISSMIIFLVGGGFIIAGVPTVVKLINTTGLDPISATFTGILYSLLFLFGGLYILYEYMSKQ